MLHSTAENHTSRLLQPTMWFFRYLVPNVGYSPIILNHCYKDLGSGGSKAIPSIGHELWTMCFCTRQFLIYFWKFAILGQKQKSHLLYKSGWDGVGVNFGTNKMKRVHWDKQHDNNSISIIYLGMKFCGEIICLSYFCNNCWKIVHGSRPSLAKHVPQKKLISKPAAGLPIIPGLVNQ